MRPIKIMCLLFMGCLGILTPMEAQAQTVKIKRVAMSPRLLGTYTGFPVSTGLRTVPIGMKVYFNADTTGAVTTFAWTVETKPAGSAPVFSDATAKNPTLVPDLAGQYIVSVSIDGGKTDKDTLYASTFAGMPATGLSCGTCHAAVKAKWEKTGHATLYQRGITGQLEVADVNGKYVGQYGQTCIKCHTTGWEPGVNNGNFGFETKKVGFDTTWYAGLDVISAGRYYVPFKDMTRWNTLTGTYPNAAKVGSISCESCHGPGTDHTNNGGNKSMISRSIAGGVCAPCHDAPSKHLISQWWEASAHASMPMGGASAPTREACFPCHNGDAFVAYTKNMQTPDYKTIDLNNPMKSVSCATCHDPHSNENLHQVRTTKIIPLMNGYIVPDNVGGLGILCMNCHRGRRDSKITVEAQARVYGNRFYPHYNPQADMFLGTNAYEFGLPLDGLHTHAGLENSCVTCHMADRKTSGTSTLPNHELLMKNETGADIVTSCVHCHGEITKFDDIRAMDDYDGNGRIEGVQTEIQNMLDNLKNILPKAAGGDVVQMNVDSMKVKNDPLYAKNGGLSLLGAIWNYWFIKKDHSVGVHNTKYTLALLKATFSALAGPNDVSPFDNTIPKGFALSQNYPNPFNPSTNIRFSIPRGANVQLRVYNASGQLVTTLADGYIVPGNYAATWDASNAGSGLYFYQLTAVANGKLLYSTSKKMVLAK